MIITKQYQHSGMTIKAFAESIGVKPPTVYFWLQKFIKANNNTSPNILIEITSLVTPISSSMNHLSIKEVEVDVDDKTLLKIVRELR